MADTLVDKLTAPLEEPTPSINQLAQEQNQPALPTTGEGVQALGGTPQQAAMVHTTKVKDEDPSMQLSTIERQEDVSSTPVDQQAAAKAEKLRTLGSFNAKTESMLEAALAASKTPAVSATQTVGIPQQTDKLASAVAVADDPDKVTLDNFGEMDEATNSAMAELLGPDWKTKTLAEMKQAVSEAQQLESTSAEQLQAKLNDPMLSPAQKAEISRQLASMSAAGTMARETEAAQAAQKTEELGQGITDRTLGVYSGGNADLESSFKALPDEQQQKLMGYGIQGLRRAYELGEKVNGDSAAILGFEADQDFYDPSVVTPAQVDTINKNAVAFKDATGTNVASIMQTAPASIKSVLQDVLKADKWRDPDTDEELDSAKAMDRIAKNIDELTTLAKVIEDTGKELATVKESIAAYGGIGNVPKEQQASMLDSLVDTLFDTDVDVNSLNETISKLQGLQKFGALDQTQSKHLKDLQSVAGSDGKITWDDMQALQNQGEALTKGIKIDLLSNKAKPTVEFKDKTITSANTNPTFGGVDALAYQMNEQGRFTVDGIKEAISSGAVSSFSDVVKLVDKGQQFNRVNGDARSQILQDFIKKSTSNEALGIQQPSVEVTPQNIGQIVQTPGVPNAIDDTLAFVEARINALNNLKDSGIRNTGTVRRELERLSSHASWLKSEKVKGDTVYPIERVTMDAGVPPTWSW